MASIVVVVIFCGIIAVITVMWIGFIIWICTTETREDPSRIRRRLPIVVPNIAMVPNSIQPEIEDPTTTTDLA